MNPDNGSEASPSRRIVLCADDFGMNAAVNAGILQLAQQGRLSGTSLLVDGPQTEAGVPALGRTSVQIGLHLNLTESFGQPGLCQPLKALILTACARQLPADAVQAALQRQWARFQQLTGRTPDYIDGHQHVHQLPVVREVLLRFLGTLDAPRPWIRDTSRPRSRGLPWRIRLKAAIIAGLGARALRRAARSQGFAGNVGFLGVYDFQGGVDAYARYLQAWFLQAQNGDVLMCHPALGSAPEDALSSQRQAEYTVLAGPLVGRLLQTSGFEIERGGQGPPRGARQ